VILEQVGCRIFHAPNMVIVLPVRRQLLVLIIRLVLEYHCLNNLWACFDGANEAKYCLWAALALGALDVARAVVFKGGPDAHEFLELLFPFFRRELLLEVTHIRGGDDTTKMDEITAQRDAVLRLRLLVLDDGEQKSGDGNSRSMGLGYITILPKPQQPVEAMSAPCRAAGLTPVVALAFLHELSAQLSMRGWVERRSRLPRVLGTVVSISSARTSS